MSTTSTLVFLLGMQVTRYFNVAGLAILFYDYWITLGTEMHWIWGRRWGATRIIYTLARYLPFIGASMTVYSAVVIRTGNCQPFVTATEVIRISGIVAAEGLLVQRTYTFWNGSKRLLVWLQGFAAILVALAIFLSTREHAPAGYPNPGGCLFFSSKMNGVVFGFLLLFDIVLLCLIICSSMTMAIYRNGMMYISCIIIMTLANIIVTVSAPVEYMYSLLTLQIVIHGVLASRVLFDLRQSEATEYEHLTPWA